VDVALLGWLALFALVAAVIIGAGAMLARSGDRIADRTGLGGLLVGVVLIAAATSLPEIAVTVSAAIDGAADLAVGNLLGSNMANMALLAVVDLAYRGRVWHHLSPGHGRTAAAGIALTAIAVLAILQPATLAIGWIGVASIVIFFGYLALLAWTQGSATPVVSAGATSHAEAELGTSHGGAPSPVAVVVPPAAPGPTRASAATVRRDLATVGVAAVIILVAAPFLVMAAEGIASASGLGQTFVGASFLAFATSLPELATAVAAARIGAFDLAVGSLLGSNAFNMATILVADLAYTSGPILSAVDTSQAFVGVSAILLMALASAAIAHAARTRSVRWELSSLMTLATYALLMYLIWTGSD
jgi:cation:H+ antiporter